MFIKIIAKCVTPSTCELFAHTTSITLTGLLIRVNNLDFKLKFLKREQRNMKMGQFKKRLIILLCEYVTVKWGLLTYLLIYLLNYLITYLLNYLLNYLLTYLLHGAESFLRSWLVLQLVKKFPAFYRTRKFIRNCTI